MTSWAPSNKGQASKYERRAGETGTFVFFSDLLGYWTKRIIWFIGYLNILEKENWFGMRTIILTELKIWGENPPFSLSECFILISSSSKLKEILKWDRGLQKCKCSFKTIFETLHIFQNFIFFPQLKILKDQLMCVLNCTIENPLFPCEKSLIQFFYLVLFSEEVPWN